MVELLQTLFGGSGVTLVMSVLFLVLVAFFIMSAMGRLYRKVPPNKVLIIYGPKIRGGTRVVSGGATIIIPLLEDTGLMGLEIMTIPYKETIMTRNGVEVKVSAIAQVKVGADEDTLLRAAEHFLGRDQKDIEQRAHETLSGSIRAVVSVLTPVQVHRERDSLIQEVEEVVAGEMDSLGLHLVSLTIQDVSDEEGYYEALAAEDIADVKRDAKIAQAEADREAREREAEETRAAEEAEFLSKTEIARSEKEYKVKAAQYQRESETERADAEMAYPLQEANLKQELAERDGRVAFIEEQKRTEVAQQAAERRERELDAEVRRPAEAEAFRIQEVARAERAAAEEEAEALRAKEYAAADGQKAHLLAEAEGIKAKGLAEAEAKSEQAKALNAYEQIGLAQVLGSALIEQLPALFAEVAAPMSQIDDITILQAGGGNGRDGESPVNQFVDVMPATVLAASQLVEKLTGYSIQDLARGEARPRTADTPADGATPPKQDGGAGVKAGMKSEHSAEITLPGREGAGDDASTDDTGAER